MMNLHSRPNYYDVYGDGKHYFATKAYAFSGDHDWGYIPLERSFLDSFWFQLGILVIAGALLYLLFKRWMKQWEEENRRKLQEEYRQMPESVREGSPFLTVSAPKFVGGVYGLLKDKKVLIATTWRYGDYLVTAGHAVRDPEFSGFLIRNHKNDYHRVDNWFDIGPDLSVAYYSPMYEFTNAKVDLISKPTHAQIYASRDTHNSSLGILKHVPEVAMGFVEFSGSTQPSFSGAPYYNGSRVLGMHLGGGTVSNYGYSASYICMLLKKWRRPESSELEMIRGMLRKARSKDVDYEVQLDEVMIRVGGRYELLDADEFYTLMEEEEFENYFYEVSEEGERKSKQKFRTRKARPEYEEEAAGVEEEEEPAFLEVFPGSSSMQSAPGTSQPSIPTPETPTTPIQMKDISGLEEELSRLNEVLLCTLQNERKHYQDLLIQQELSLKSHYLTLLEQTKSDFDSRLSRVWTDLTSISNTVSALSTQSPPPVSANSPSLPRSGIVWDGMESDFRKLKEWAALNMPSSPGYESSRYQFLTSLGLNGEQSWALVNRLRNWRLTQKRKVRKLARPVATFAQPPVAPPAAFATPSSSS